jgi:hypothetical protein
MIVALAAGVSLAGSEVVAPELTFGLGFGGGLGAGGAASPGSGGGSAGVAAAWFPTRRVGINLGVREGLWSSDLRFVGQISVGARWRAARSLDVFGGFVHHHETPWAAAVDDPLGALVGVSDGIRHRSGVELGVSRGWTVAEVEGFSAVFRVDAAASVLAGQGPLVYGQVNVGLWAEVPELRR